MCRHRRLSPRMYRFVPAPLCARHTHITHDETTIISNYASSLAPSFVVVVVTQRQNGVDLSVNACFPMIRWSTSSDNVADSDSTVAVRFAYTGWAS